MTLQAADGFRLSIRKADLSNPVPKPIKSVIPARAFSELARVSSDGDQPVIMVIPPGRGQVIFHAKDVELVSQLIEGSFPRLRARLEANLAAWAPVITALGGEVPELEPIFARYTELAAQIAPHVGDVTAFLAFLGAP